ncbi:MAG: XRE family transcriptional regulator [Chlorobi bacterium]|nr:XRE family transcriptional regulator [Chlorobiota bacterium]
MDEATRRMQCIGANLRALRRKTGKTLEEVATKAGVSVSHLANAEHGRRMLHGELLRNVLVLYGYSLAVFMSHIEKLIQPLNENRNSDAVIPASPIPLMGYRPGQGELHLLHPVFSVEESAHLLLILPPEQELWHSYIVLPARCSVGVARGALLIETPQREFLLNDGEYATILPHQPHRFRNHTLAEARAYIWVETACI